MSSFKQSGGKGGRKKKDPNQLEFNFGSPMESGLLANGQPRRAFCAAQKIAAFLKPIQYFDFQERLATKLYGASQNGGWVLFAPTSKGKTYVSAPTIANCVADGLKVYFIVPTRSLARKMAEEKLPSLLNLANGEIVEYTGKATPKKRAEIANGAKIIVATPQTIQKDIEAGRLSLDGSAVMLDEIHHLQGNHAYAVVAEYAKSAGAKIFGMTATPKRDEVESILGKISPSLVAFVPSKDESIAQVFPKVKITNENCPLTPLQVEFILSLRDIMQNRIISFFKTNFPSVVQKEGFIHDSDLDGLKAPFGVKQEVVEQYKANYRETRRLIGLAESEGVMMVHDTLAKIATEVYSEYTKKIRENPGRQWYVNVRDGIADAYGISANSNGTVICNPKYPPAECYRRFLSSYSEIYTSAINKFGPARHSPLRKLFLHKSYAKLHREAIAVLDENMSTKDTILLNRIGRLSGEKTIVFVSLVSQAFRLEALINEQLGSKGAVARAFVGHGNGIPAKELDARIDSFQSDDGEANVLICTSAGNEGHDFEATQLFFYSVGSDMVAYTQQFGRVGRGTDPDKEDRVYRLISSYPQKTDSSDGSGEGGESNFERSKYNEASYGLPSADVRNIRLINSRSDQIELSIRRLARAANAEFYNPVYVKAED